MKVTVICIVLFLSAVPIAFSSAGEGTGDPHEMKQDTDEYQFELRRQAALARQRENPLNEVNEFTTDGCSGGLSAGWNFFAGKLNTFQQIHGRLPPWESCCISHDQVYHTAGGSVLSAEDSYELRLQADRDLRTCLQDTGRLRAVEHLEIYGLTSQEVTRIYEVISDLMYKAVRIGGIPCTGLPWRWGYGWPECE